MEALQLTQTANPVQQQPSHEQAAARIDELVHELEQVADPVAQERVRELVQAVLDLHGTGLHRMLDRVYEAAGQSLVDELARDELVGGLLALHGLHPLSLEARVLQALDKVRPYLASHDGGVQLLGVTPDDRVRLRLEGTCHGCPSSRVTLQYAVEEAIYEAAPEITTIDVEGAVEDEPVTPGNGFMPLPQANGHADPAKTTRRNGSEGWVDVDLPDTVEAGTVQVVDVSSRPVLLCRVGETLYAYEPVCPHCHGELSDAVVTEARLTCPACGHRYDLARAGRSLDDTETILKPYPLLREEQTARIAVPQY